MATEQNKPDPDCGRRTPPVVPVTAELIRKYSVLPSITVQLLMAIGEKPTEEELKAADKP